MSKHATLAHAIYAPIKRILPAWVARPIRSLVTALLTPIAFARDTGHFRSALRTRAVDSRGEPIPWYTYPAIEFLHAKDLSGLRVLEFGVGQSTLWWAKHARSVLAIEDNPVWIAELAPRLSANAEVRHATDWRRPGDALGPEAGPVDLIVIDGLDRFAAARLALDLPAEDGAVLLDNSDGFWGPEGTYPIIDLFREAGFLRIDFYGYAPGVRLAHCTSLFFRSGQRCRLLVGEDPPLRGGPRALGSRRC